MRFLHPWALILIPLAWIASAAAAYFGRKAALSFSAGRDALRRPPSLKTRAADWAPIILPALALTCAAIGLARPQSVLRLPGDDGRGIDIVLAVDTSLSMTATDFKPNRIEVAKEIARDFIRRRVSDRIGIITFGGAPLLVCPPTTDVEALIERLDAMTAGMTGVDGTAIGDGLLSAARRLKDSPARSKVVVLLTDGRSNTGIVDPVTAAKTLAALGIKLYAVGTAGRGPAMMVIDDPKLGHQTGMTDDDLDEELLAQIAGITGGRSYRAENREELARIFSEIDRLEKSEIKRPPIIAATDRHMPFLILAALALALESALSATVLLRWP